MINGSIHERMRTAVTMVVAVRRMKPAAIYLGRVEMDELMQWAYDNQYISDMSLRDGKHRPEVGGLPVYQVNAETHLIVAPEI